MQEYLPDFKITNAALHFDEASRYMRVIFKQEVKKKGKNHDLPVVEYKVAKEEKIENSNIFQSN